MDTAEYQNIYNHETTHFVYVATHEIILEFLKTYLPSHTGRRLKLLDAGCGTGGLTQKLKIFGAVWGLDISPYALALAKRRGIRHLVRASVAKLPFSDNSFDALTCVDVLYNASISNDMTPLKEFFRVLKPGGIVVLKVPSLNWFRRHHDIIAHTGHRYSAREVRYKLKQTGFRMLRVSCAFFLLLPVLMVKVMIVEKLLCLSTHSDITQLPAWLNTLCIAVSRLEKVMIRRISFPLGVSVFAVAKKV